MMGAAKSLRDFLAAGGRVWAEPNGKAEISYNVALIFGGDVPDPLALSRYQACQAFVRCDCHPAGAAFAARAVRMLGASTPNGFRVLRSA